MSNALLRINRGDPALVDFSMYQLSGRESVRVLDRLRYIGNTFEVESLPLKEAYEELSNYPASPYQG